MHRRRGDEDRGLADAPYALLADVATDLWTVVPPPTPHVRIIARRDGPRARLYSRPGNDLTDRFPLIVDSGRPWPSEPYRKHPRYPEGKKIERQEHH